MEDFNRYAVIHTKNRREIVLLRGRGCAYRQCRFCDYHLDSSLDAALNAEINAAALEKVAGLYGRLEVINSGSFVDLDEKTIRQIAQVCLAKKISWLHFECHWIHRDKVPMLKERFSALGIAVKVKTGVETFDALFRESYLSKGIDTEDPAEIARYFDEACLLFGLPGQTAASMQKDIETGLAYFERICINILQANSRPVKPDPAVAAVFQRELYPLYEQNERIDILLHNTDFGVGGSTPQNG